MHRRRKRIRTVRAAQAAKARGASRAASQLCRRTAAAPPLPRRQQRARNARTAAAGAPCRRRGRFCYNATTQGPHSIDASERPLRFVNGRYMRIHAGYARHAAPQSFNIAEFAQQQKRWSEGHIDLSEASLAPVRRAARALPHHTAAGPPSFVIRPRVKTLRAAELCPSPRALASRGEVL